VLERLGEGGMGIVYTAYDNELDRKVAVKVLRDDTDRRDPHARDRLLREAQAMARLSHPNIVAVHEAGWHEGQVFIAMEFVRGHNLGVWLQSADHAWRDDPRPAPASRPRPGRRPRRRPGPPRLQARQHAGRRRRRGQGPRLRPRSLGPRPRPAEQPADMRTR
jgi:hypothetical protein